MAKNTFLLILFSVGICFGGNVYAQETKQIGTELQARGGAHLAEDPVEESAFASKEESSDKEDAEKSEFPNKLDSTSPEYRSDSEKDLLDESIKPVEMVAESTAPLEIELAEGISPEAESPTEELSLEDLREMYQWDNQKHNVREKPVAFRIKPKYEMAWRTPSSPPSMGVNILVPEVPGFYSGRDYHLNLSLRLNGELIPVQTKVTYFTDGADGMVAVNMTDIIREYRLNPFEIKATYPLSESQKLIIDEGEDPGSTLVECISNMVRESFRRNWTLSPILTVDTP